MKRSLLILMYCSFFFAVACGDEEAQDLCENITCDHGICDIGSGECINAADCGTSNDACLAGYECEAGTCTVTVACDIDNPCDRGTCVDNSVCLNPTSCNTNANCLGGFFCTDDNVCSDDLCSDTVCDNGICELGTGACVNADTCRQETQAQDCLAGFGCVQGACVNEADYCEELDCQRGVCSFEEQGCIDAPDCAGDDVVCLSGNYCDDANACQTNRCDVLGTDCPRGVCDPGQGVCVDAATCTASAVCVDAKVCLDGTCTPTAEACGATGCTGNQECAFNEATLMAACEENTAGCLAAVDCTGDRICANRACADPGACGDDALEPNNVTGQESDIVSVHEELTICTGDTDIFIFDTTTDPDVFGMLNVVVEIEAADVGLGEIKIELVNPIGNIVQSGSSLVAGTATALIDLRHLIDFVTQGKYIIRVTGDGVSTAGVRYTLRTDVVNPNVLTACGMATAIDPSIPTSGNTAMGGSVELKSCGDSAGLAKENIFALTIDVPSFVTLRALPAVDVDVSISLRTICAQDDTDLECANTAGASDPEQIETALSPGTYYVVVESEQASEGAYSIVTTLEPIICETADNTCADANNANVCNAKGTAFENEACDNGCDMMINRCTRDAGDVCDTAIPVTGTYSGSINWTNFIGDYNPDIACVPLSSQFSGDISDADGEDAVFAVTIPPGNALVASLDGSFSQNVSMYFVTDCLNINTTCLSGANAGRSNDEALFYENSTAADIAGFLVVDRGSSATSSSSSDIEISIAPVICTPGAAQCVFNRESQICNLSGTAFDVSTSCNFGCDMATGLCVAALNDVCGGAVELTPGVTETGDSSILTGSYNPVGCSGRTTGRDAVYVVKNVAPGSVINVVMNSTWDAYLWVAKECNADVLSTCLAFEDDPEDLTIVATEGGDYYFVADTYGSFSGSGAFTITATVASPQCNAGELLGCLNATTLQYCDSTGQIIDLVCGGVCSNDACAAPGGDICYDAKPLTATLTDQTEMGTTDNGGSNSLTPSGSVGSCNFSSALDESDKFFTVNIPPEHSLEIDFDSGSIPDLYILDSTCALNSCKDQLTTDGDIDYYSLLGETVVIVIDASSISGSATSNEWEFDYKIVPHPGRFCNAGRSQCTGNVAEVCNETQTGYTSYACPNGCANGLCIDDPVVTQTCATAPDVTAGFIGQINEDDYTNDVDGACGTDSDGGDAHFQVSLLPGEIVNVQVRGGTGSWFPQAYIYTDCLDPAASCQAGSDYAKNTEVSYQATVAETVFIGIDNASTFANDDDQASIIIEILQPECMNGQATVCNADGDALVFCASSRFQEIPCGGNGVCTADKCENPGGDICADAIQLDGTPAGVVPISGTFSGATLGFAADEETVAGACRFNGTDGRDRIYEIPLIQGDSLKITHDGATDTYIAFVEDCTDTNTCLASNLLAVDDVTIEFVAQTTRSYFLIVKSENSSTTTFTFDYEVTSASGKICNPDSFYCLDATTVAACNSDGQIRTQYNCPAGCSEGACTSDAGSATCGTAPTVVDGGYFLEYFANGSNDVDLTAASCTGDESSGSDYFYAIDVVANEIVDLRINVYNEADDPMVYIFTDCTDAQTSCLAGMSDRSRSQTLTYQSPIDQRIYVGMDAVFAADDSWFALEIEVRQSDCMPGITPQTCTVDTTAFQYCDDTGLLQTYDCGGAGMCDATTNRCTAPVGDACLDPFDATPAAVATPTLMAGTIAGNDDYSLVAGNICTGSQTPANDQTYVVDLTAGQVLTASLVSTAGTPEDLAMYLTSDCDAVPNSCLAGTDAQPAGAMPETLTYTATGDETVYIIVDSFFANAAGTFDLTVEVN